MIKMKVVDVKIGMILGEDIYNKYDVLVISSGTIINKQNYRVISNLYLDFVNIMQKQVKGNDKVIIVDCVIQQKYEKTVESFKKLYNNIKIGKQIIADEVNEIIAPLVDEVINNKNFTKKLWQIESCDEYTYDHSVTVSLTSALLGKWLGLSNDRITDLAAAGILHDIGKCNIPDEILKKPDKLSDDEYKVMKTHSTLGYIMLKNSHEFSDEVLFGIYQHHEKYDGKGYPNMIKGEEIELFGRIIAIADVYSAMTSNRVYREKMSPFLVAKLIIDNSFGYLDPKIVSIFLNNISNFYIGTIVKLNDGRVGEVVMTNMNEPYRPLVKVEDDYVDLSKNYSIQIEALID